MSIGLPDYRGVSQTAPPRTVGLLDRHGAVAVLPCLKLTKRAARPRRIQAPTEDGLHRHESLWHEMLWRDVEQIRARSPLVHNITNYVVMNTDIVGEMTAERSDDPGSLQLHMLDAPLRLDARERARRLRVEIE